MKKASRLAAQMLILGAPVVFLLLETAGTKIP